MAQTRLAEAKAILELVETTNGRDDTLTLLQKAGYSEETAEGLLESSRDILDIALTDDA